MKMLKFRKHSVSTSFHKNDFLLLQFILSEFLCSYTELNTLRKYRKEMIALFENTAKDIDKLAKLKNLKASVELLSGTALNSMKIFSWKQDDGLLNKLNHYCALLSQNHFETNKNAQNIYKFVNESWIACMELHELISILPKLPTAEWPDHFKMITSFEEKIFKKFRQFSKLLPETIKEHSDNENVIFFLLRHQQEFARLIHPDFIHNLFKMYYTDGVEGAKKMLLEKYHKRGFYQLLPIIMEKFQTA